MRVIQTHENADFDAVASLLAAHKLFPEATPVLPRRVNRNVRHFVNLYWEALPFVRPDDLGRRERVDSILLVDTQSFSSLRGMVRKPEVWVIDHHPPAEDLDPDWRFEGEPIGATTSLLVARFAEQGIRPTPIEATLLLLGIYEDTGSLTYAATSAADAQAVAWLLEHGGDLTLLLRFLHHPLSKEQRELYSALQQAAETHLFDGQTVVIAAVEAPTYADEISTLAHKMRDLYEPAAVFLLVYLEHHIQLVARSTTDSIDVGQVAAYFGGGGHDRAAAAIVRNDDLAAAREELLQLLPSIVRPVTTVGEIMSRGVETFAPETTIVQAHQRMLRMGYEGYPVVEDGQVIGLLTRRDIDRALQHKLGQAEIRRFMTAGKVSVRPEESVRQLQRVMMEHNWGQVPVVSESDGRVLGIVTRTDVIKLWQPRPASVERDLMRTRMAQQLPPAVMRLVHRVSELAQEMGIRVYFVGGLVRDLLLKIPNMDLDMVVEGDAIRLVRSLAQHYGGRVRAHERFGTAKWILQDDFWGQFGPGNGNGRPLPQTIDFVTARSEFYDRPTALPQVRSGSIKLDLHRRDFTINTLALSLNPDRFGELLDFYGGKRDLERGLIRVLHSLSFIDDPTRILRAVRFEQRLGFRIEERTEELLHQSVTLLDRVTGDRIRHELELMLREPQPELGFGRLDDLGILTHIHPALHFDKWAETHFKRLRQVLEEPMWAPTLSDLWVEISYFGILTYRMSLDELDELEKRLRVQRATRETVRLVQTLKNDLPRLAEMERPSEVTQLLRDYPPRVLAISYAAAEQGRVCELMERYVREWSRVEIHISGRDLREMGLKPGPRYRELLDRVLFATLDGRIQGLEKEQEYLAALLEQD